MTYEECQAIIEQFEKSQPNVVMNPNAHGIQVVLDGEESVLQLVVTAKIGHVSNSMENDFTLWKDGRVEGWKQALPIFHPSNHKDCKEVSETCPVPAEFYKHIERRQHHNSRRQHFLLSLGKKS